MNALIGQVFYPLTICDANLQSELGECLWWPRCGKLHTGKCESDYELFGVRGGCRANLVAGCAAGTTTFQASVHLRQVLTCGQRC